MKANVAVRTRVWEPIDGAQIDPLPPAWQPVALEREILAVLDEPASPGERIEVAFRRKEQQLASIFVRLVPAESLALQRRLTLALSGDPIAARFAQLVIERRTRLLTCLSESRRRHPLQTARMGGGRG